MGAREEDSARTLPVPADDHPLRKRAHENLAARAGIDEDLARDLLEAAVRASEAEVLLSLGEETPVPGSMSDARAYRLYRISTLLDRTPEDYEVGAIFRVPESMARTIIARMEATYPSLRERGLAAALRETAGPARLWKPAGGSDRYEVEYPSRRGREALERQLRRLGVTDVRQGSNARSVSFPKTTAGGENVLDHLGIERPPDDPGRR